MSDLNGRQSAGPQQDAPSAGLRPAPVRVPIGEPVRVPGPVSDAGSAPLRERELAPEEALTSMPVGQPGAGPVRVGQPTRMMGPPAGIEGEEDDRLRDGPEIDQFSSAEGQTKYGFRDTVRLAAASLRLVLAASRRDLLLIVTMDVLQALAIFLVIVQLQRLITTLILANDGNHSEELVKNVALFALANIVGVVAQA